MLFGRRSLNNGTDCFGNSALLADYFAHVRLCNVKLNHNILAIFFCDIYSEYV